MAPAGPDDDPMVIAWIGYDGRTAEPVRLTEAFGTFIRWSRDDRRFTLWDRRGRAARVTECFEEFLRWLDALPPGTIIEHFDTCSVSRAFEMPDAAWQRLRRVMRDGNLTWAVREGLAVHVICTCESTGLLLP
jgi:hypothetical protein